MPSGEFDLIQRWFTRPARRAVLGVGDDCALLAPAPGQQLALSTDTLVEGRHFLSTVAPHRLGHKALAVNLSDLAACGAAPRAFLLSLTLPRVDEHFLEGFARGLFALADAHDVELVGGNTTAGPLAIGITVVGDVPPGQALLRSGARPGDDVWVSHPVDGGLGDARLALEVFRGRAALDAAAFERVRARMEQPTPRVALGQALRGIATSAIDISDGLLGDLSHVLRASGVGATINTQIASNLIATNAYQICRNGIFGSENVLDFVMAGGDDYEIAFTAPAQQHAAVLAAAHACQTRVTHIGHMTAASGVQLLDANGQVLPNRYTSFDHFA